MKLTRKQQALFDSWMPTGNPRPAFLDEKDEQLLQLNLRRHLERQRRRAEGIAPVPVLRKPREFTRKRPGSRRFNRLRGVLDTIHDVHGSTARSLPTLTPRE